MTTKNKTVKGEWIFQLQRPINDEIVELKVTQDIEINQLKTNQPSSTPTPPLIGEQEEPPLEIVSLLDNDATSASAKQESSSYSSSSWSFSNPTLGYKLQSSFLVQIIYKPAWQGLPSFTNAQRQEKWKRAFCCSADVREQIMETYTVDHIYKTKMISSLSIRGVPTPCQAVQIWLQPHEKPGDATLETPDAYESELQQQLQHHSMSNQQVEAQYESRFSRPSDTLPRIQQNSNDDDNDNENHQYIIVTFAMPTTVAPNNDPPLLYKVQLPSKQYQTVALDTVTVMDASINFGSNEEPTHVYIQGYQSWSHTTSIPKGVKQPQPAMANVFSRAFNLGATIPNYKSTTHSIPYPTLKQLQPPLSKPRYVSDFFACITCDRKQAIDELGGPALMVGWLSQHEQYGLVTVNNELTRVVVHASNQGQLLSSINVETDWAYVQLVSPNHYSNETPMKDYIHAVAAYHEAKPLHNGPVMTGWCSWYHYYENISRDNLQFNFEKLAALKPTVPTTVAVVDDGYMTAWGDWTSLKPGKFTDMNTVSQDILNSDIRPGLWLAPYTCDKHSTLAREHPDWIIRNEQGYPANSSNCGKFFYGLDATNPQVRQYVHECIKRAVEEWKFTYLKLDFLYAACLHGNGKYDITMSRAQAMHLALQTIRDAAGPNVFIVACGCPIGPAIGYVDGMRVSADTGPTWKAALPLPPWDQGTLPSLRGMIRNSITRAPMGHVWWHNDPDCLLVGTSTWLTDNQVTSAISIVGMTCGMMLLSDDLAKIPANRMTSVTKIMPMTGATAIPLNLHVTYKKKSSGIISIPSLLQLWCTDQYNLVAKYRRDNPKRNDDNSLDEATYFGRHVVMSSSSITPTKLSSVNFKNQRNCIHVTKGLGSWTIISLSNWTESSKVCTIPKQAIKVPSTSNAGYHVLSFWSGKYQWIPSSSDDDIFLSKRLEAHETEIFHIKPVSPQQPQYIGSDLHFSCGQEVQDFELKKNLIILTLKQNLQKSGNVYLYLPTTSTSNVRVKVNGKEPGRWSVIGNTPTSNGTVVAGRVISVMVSIQASPKERLEQNGIIQVWY